MSPVTRVAEIADLIEHGAPRLIHTDEELEAYAQALFTLTVKSKPTQAEEYAIELLTLLIEHYEAEHYPIPDATPAEVLRFLLDQNGLTQRDLVPELGNEATVSLLVSGKRAPTREHIEKLSRRFKVSPAVFFSM